MIYVPTAASDVQLSDEDSDLVLLLQGRVFGYHYIRIKYEGRWQPLHHVIARRKGVALKPCVGFKDRNRYNCQRDNIITLKGPGTGTRARSAK